MLLLQALLRAARTLRVSALVCVFDPLVPPPCARRGWYRVIFIFGSAYASDCAGLSVARGPLV